MHDNLIISVVPEVFVHVESAARLRVAHLDEQRQHLRPLLGLDGVLDGDLRDDWQKVRKGLLRGLKEHESESGIIIELSIARRLGSYRLPAPAYPKPVA